MIGIYATHVQCRKSILGIWFLKLIFQSPNFVILTTLPKVWDILQLEYYEFFLKICTLSAKQEHYSTYSLIWSGCVLPCHSSPTTKWATYSENLILSFILEFLHTEKCTYLLYMMVFYIILRTFRVKKVYVDSMSLSRASLKYVKCPKKDSVIKVSLESDLLFSVEIWLKVNS